MAAIFPRPTGTDWVYCLQYYAGINRRENFYNDRAKALKQFRDCVIVGYEAVLLFRDDATGSVEKVAYYPGHVY